MKRRETEGYSTLIEEPPLHKYVYPGKQIVKVPTPYRKGILIGRNRYEKNSFN